MVIAGHLFYLQIIRGGHYYKISKNNRIRVVPLEGRRGRILDRNGKVLADNQPAFNVMITPQEIRAKEKIFSFLGQVLEVDRALLMERYTHQKWTPFTPVVIAEDIPWKQAVRIEENKYRFPSLFIQKRFKRIYPQGQNAAHVIGYTGKINRSQKQRLKEYGFSYQSIIGKTGVEEYYDSYLKGTQGGKQIEVNSRGEQVSLVSLKEPQKGQAIQLTLDSDMNRIAQQALQGKVGSIVMMDIDNGEILAMANSPSYDPNIFVDKQKRRRFAHIFKNPNSPFLNRAITGLFPPGSVFKVPVAICGLDRQEITPRTSFECKGFYELAGMKFRCAHVHGMQNLAEALIHSCNVYFYHLGRMLGSEAISQSAHLLGLGKQTFIDLPFESTGRVPSKRQGVLSANRRWYTGDTLNLSIGQGDVLTTPLQLVKMMATVASEGTEVQPHVIRKIGGTPSKKFDFQKELMIDKSIFRAIKKALVATVTDYSGTAHALDIDGLHIGGKTGTAQAAPHKEHHAWFVGYLVGQGRKIAFCVFLEHGGSSQNVCILGREFLLALQKHNKI
jgi:penicillin-binding protein 2